MIIEDPNSHFPCLNIRFLKIQAGRWVKKYSETPLQRILLYSFSCEFEGEILEIEETFKPLPIKYAVVFEVDAEIREYRLGRRHCVDKRVSRIYEATKPDRQLSKNEKYYHFMTADFEGVYKDHLPINWHYEWTFIIKFKDDELNANIRTDESPWVLWEHGKNDHLIDSNEPRRIEPISQDASFIQKIEVGYENDYEFRIKIPGKSPKPCTWGSLGCRNERTDEFKYLLEAIQESSIVLKDDNKRKTFHRGCKRLVGYIKKEYSPSLPDSFKIYEKIAKGTFRLIFKKIEEPDFDPTKKLKKMPEKQLLQELKKLVDEEIPKHITDKEIQEEWRRKQNDKITNAAIFAKEQGITNEEIEDIILKKTDIESVTDKETMRDDSVNQCLNEGLRIIKP